jgi:hypothetical protein
MLSVIGFRGGAISDIPRLSFRGGLFTAPILCGVRELVKILLGGYTNNFVGGCFGGSVPLPPPPKKKRNIFW